MVERSLQISAANRSNAQAAFKGLGLSQEQFAAQFGISRKTVSNFLNGKPIDRALFVQLCERLKLDWQAMLIGEVQVNGFDLDALVQDVRSRLSQQIERNYSKITLLNGEFRAIDQLYVEVYLLDKRPSTMNWDWVDWMNHYEPERDRMGIAERGERETGMTVVTKQGFERLVILGKPGYGKTTFLKHLALLCNRGGFLPTCIPILLELRDLDDETLDLPQWIHAELGCATPTDTEMLLKQGRVLLLLDGLDEVPSEWQAKFQTKLRSFFRRNAMLPVIMTCRTQTTEFIPNGFECAEVAEFNPEQVKEFVEQWFDAKVSAEGASQSQRFLTILADNKPVRELMRTPLLLSLACWIFTDRGQLPTKRSELYEQGVDLLLNRWDEKRPGYGTVKRHCDSEIYKALTLEQRKDLLGYLAFEKFTHPQALSNGNLNFILYEETELESLIAKKLNRLPTECRDLPALIEAQHGLLVARTYKNWSFSHLTFQEYFTARELVANAEYDRLVPHMAEPRWREVFLLTVGMMRKADVLVRSMKQGIDNLSAQDAKLQEFLTWVAEKSCSVETSYKPAAVRAFYFACGRYLALALTLTLGRGCDRAFVLGHDHDRVLGLGLDRDRELILTRFLHPDYSPLNCVFAFDRNRELVRHMAQVYDRDSEQNGILARVLARGLGHDRAFILGLDHKRILELVIACDSTLALDITLDIALDIACVLELVCNGTITPNSDPLALARALNIAVAIAITHSLNPELCSNLQRLRAQLPDFSVKNFERFRHWWQTEGHGWCEELRTVMIDHRNIGHDWQFSDEQKQLLRQYYDANKLLVDCLNSDCSVSPEVRQEIEDTLLLPIAEI